MIGLGTLINTAAVVLGGLSFVGSVLIFCVEMSVVKSSRKGWKGAK